MTNNQSVLITGGAGFIGSHVAKACARIGYDVTIVDKDYPAVIGLASEDIRPSDENILDEEMLEQLFIDISPSIVIHLAAHTSAPHSMINPLLDIDANVKGTLNVLQSCKRVGVKHLVFASSCAVYGNGDDRRPTREIYRSRPISVYGASKLAAEAYIRLYSDIYGIHHTIFRLGNVYGPGGAGVVNRFYDEMLHGHYPVIYGDGTQTRDYIYIDDVVAAITAAISRRAYDDTFNLGTGVATSVLDVCETVAEVLGTRTDAGLAPPTIGEVDHIHLDATKYQAVFEPAPFTSLPAGVLEMAGERVTNE